MSGSDRGAIFALGLVVGIAVAFAIAFWSFPWFTYPNYEAVKSITEDGQAPQNGQQLLDAYLPTFVSSNDTLAQWLMTLFAFLATVVSVWAVTLLRETLLETRNAVRSADDAVTVTREIGQAQTRAYIVVISAEYKVVDKIPEVVLTIKNCGQTPANQLISDFKCSVHKSVDMVFVRAGKRDYSLTPKGILAANSEDIIVVKARSAIDDLDKKGIKSGTHILVVNGTIRYIDVFEREWEQEVQFSVGGRYGYFAKSMVPSKEYNPERQINKDRQNEYGKKIDYRLEGGDLTFDISK